MVAWLGMVALILFALSSTSLAGPPSGPYAVPFSSSELAVWDISGDFSEEVAGVSSNITLNQDDRGKITGTGTVSDVDIQLDLTFRGSITAKSNVTSVKLSTKIVGQAFGLPASGSIKFIFEIDNATGMLVGSAKVKVCVKSLGCEKLDESVVFEIPTGDGDWELVLDLDLATNGTTLTGTGSAVLSNGRTVLLTVKGKYSPKTDLAKLAAKATGNSIAAVVRDVSGQLDIEKLTGKILGQSLKLP